MKKNNEKEVSKAIRCKHCGGPMRMYRGDVNCLMCGRTMEHLCDRCHFAESRDAAEKQVA